MTFDKNKDFDLKSTTFLTREPLDRFSKTIAHSNGLVELSSVLSKASLYLEKYKSYRKNTG